MTIAWQAQSIWAATPLSADIGRRTRRKPSDAAGSPALGTVAGWAFLRTEFTLPSGAVRRAVLRATASSTAPARQFVYRLWINGCFVGCGPTMPLGTEARCDVFDVTARLRPGSCNAIGVLAYTMEDQRFAAQLDVRVGDGNVQHYATGRHWQACTGNGVFRDAGSIGTQYYQAPREDVDWSRFPRGFSLPGFDASLWRTATVRTPFAHVVPSTVRSLIEREITAPTVRRLGDGRAVLDFGASWLGGLQCACQPDEPEDLVIRYGEACEADGSVRYHLDAGNVYEDRWHLGARRGAVHFPDGHAADSGCAELEGTWGARVFRYVELVPSDPSGERWLDDELRRNAAAFQAAVLEYPRRRPPAIFESSNAMLDQVWHLCAHTITAFNANLYVDSWTRERSPYEADAWIQQRAHAALDYAPELGRFSIDHLIARRTWPTEWPLYTILAVHDAWMATGSLRQAADQYDRLLRLLPERYRDSSSGLIVKDPGHSSCMDGDLVDWPESERDGFMFGRVNTVVNALASQAYADMADLAAALGRREDAEALAHACAQMRVSIHQRLYDPGLGGYVDGLDTGAGGRRLPHAAQHASAFALAFADVPCERLEAVGSWLRSRGMACSVYAAAVYLDGLYRAGLGAEANALMAAQRGLRTWAHMIEIGAGATMEAWDVSIKPNTTFSHPWAASPAYLLPQGLMGIRPIEPGYRRFAVIPQLGRLNRARAVMPVPSGMVEAACRLPASASGPETRADGRRRSTGTATAGPLMMDLTVPQGTSADVVLRQPGARSSSGQVRVTLDGQARLVPASADSERIAGVWCPPGSIRMSALAPGRHRIVVRPGA